MIDPHVHCRDWRQSHKETIAHALSVAERIGLSGIFDMPNTDPAITSRELVERRLEDARKVNSPVFYGLYVGLTADGEQVSEAVRAWRDFFPKPGDKVGVVGLKMFAGHSVGNLGIIKEEEQCGVYKRLGEENFTGVLAVHCEKEEFLKSRLWNPNDPETHCFARPIEAEVRSVTDQLRFAEILKFPGNLHIAHVSSPVSTTLIENYRDFSGLRVSCGVTPHHIVLDSEMMRAEEGILMKVNPPLRTQRERETLIQDLEFGLIDWIETDHAPHTYEEKKSGKYMSGFPGLPFYPHFLNILRARGFSEERLRELTHTNIERTFGINLPESTRKPDLNLHGEYEVDVYRELRK